MENYDVVIRDGEIVMDSGSVGIADIGISSGVISQIGGEIDGNEVIDAKGKIIIPGGIDAHVHLSVPPEHETSEPRWVDDFTSGSAAALAGGITTLGNMTFLSDGESLLDGLRREASRAQDQTIADIFFHPVLNEITQEVLDEITKLHEVGCNSIKIFTITPNFDSHIGNYLNAIRLAHKQGLITLIHCEDNSLIEDAKSQLKSAGNISHRYYAESRPVISEVVATQRAVSFSEVTNAPIYIVHISSLRALEVCIDAQSRGLPVYVETRPLYLHFTRDRFEDDDGAKFVGQPPLREQHDIDALWEGIRRGVIHTVCTDHAPWSFAAKLDSAHDIYNLRPGVANLQTMLPILYSEGVRSNRISLGRFVQVTSTNTAKLFGLYPRKGTISVGSDADLVVFDPELSLTVDASLNKSNSDYSVYEGWKVTGWPIATLRRGEIVYRDGKILAKAGSGNIVIRDQTTFPFL